MKFSVRVAYPENKEGLKQHCPVFYNQEKMAIDFEGIFQFLKDKNFNGPLVLEYLPEFHSELLSDALKLIKMYSA